MKERSEGLCEVAAVTAAQGCGPATQKHHRITQKTGGRHGAAARRSDRASNLLHVCDFCHLLITGHVWLDPYKAGWSLREWQEPTAVPVLYRGELAYLDDAGGVHSYEEAGT